MSEMLTVVSFSDWSAGETAIFAVSIVNLWLGLTNYFRLRRARSAKEMT